MSRHQHKRRVSPFSEIANSLQFQCCFAFRSLVSYVVKAKGEKRLTPSDASPGRDKPPVHRIGGSALTLSHHPAPTINTRPSLRVCKLRNSHSSFNTYRLRVLVERLWISWRRGLFIPIVSTASTHHHLANI